MRMAHTGKKGIHWRCSVPTCKARVVTDFDAGRILNTTNQHNHQVDTGYAKRTVTNKARKQEPADERVEANHDVTDHALYDVAHVPGTGENELDASGNLRNLYVEVMMGDVSVVNEPDAPDTLRPETVLIKAEAQETYDPEQCVLAADETPGIDDAEQRMVAAARLVEQQQQQQHSA